MPGGEHNISITQAMAHVAHQGPLPPPEVFAAYNAGLAGAAERIMAMAEREQSHRHAVELEALKCSVKDQDAQRSERRLGQLLGFGIGAIALIGSTVSVAFGAELAGGVTGLAAIASLVSVFVYGHRAERLQTTRDASAEAKEKPSQ